MNRVRGSILVSVGLLLWAPYAPAAGRRPVDRLFIPDPSATAPVEALTASDLPLSRGRADGRLGEYFDAFDVKPDKFEYTLQLLAEEESFRIYRLVYASPMPTP